MKIYLLMMLIGTLLTIIRFTSVPERRSNTSPRESTAS
jgi:hypothetical protein